MGGPRLGLGSLTKQLCEAQCGSEGGHPLELGRSSSRAQGIEGGGVRGAHGGHHQLRIRDGLEAFLDTGGGQAGRGLTEFGQVL